VFAGIFTTLAFTMVVFHLSQGVDATIS